jgi:hypothetical protein
MEPLRRSENIEATHDLIHHPLHRSVIVDKPSP